MLRWRTLRPIRAAWMTISPGIKSPHRSFTTGLLIPRKCVARGRAIRDLLAKQAADQLDRDTRGLAPFVEKRIELNDIHRTHQSGIVQQLHDQMRFAIGRAARDRSADAGRDLGIEK